MQRIIVRQHTVSSFAANWALQFFAFCCCVFHTQLVYTITCSIRCQQLFSIFLAVFLAVFDKLFIFSVCVPRSEIYNIISFFLLQVFFLFFFLISIFQTFSSYFIIFHICIYLLLPQTIQLASTARSQDFPIKPKTSE